MKRRLIFFIVSLFFLFVCTLFFGLPFLSSFLTLNIFQRVILLLLVLFIFAVLISLVVDLVFIIPIKFFLKDLVNFWKKNHSMPPVQKGVPVELCEVVDSMRIILKDSEDYIQTLESKAGLNEGHSQIITMVAHQMRTPVSGLKWMLSGMLDVGRDPEDEKLLKEAVEATDRISDIVEELLRGIGLEQGLLKEHRTSVDMCKVINDVVLETNLIARSNNISIQISKGDMVPLVEGNEQELRFVVHTLVSNAVHYSFAGGFVLINIIHTEQYVKIEVVDSGFGISQNEQAMIFTKFGRSKESISKYPDGTGLSLYLSRSIILNHQGDLTYVSKEGQGSVFTITLPIRGKGELEEFIKS